MHLYPFIFYKKNSGANVSALLLENHCELVFYLFGSCLMGEWIFIPDLNYSKIYLESNTIIKSTPSTRLVIYLFVYLQ